jgi:hypothetical protein
MLEWASIYREGGVVSWATWHLLVGVVINRGTWHRPVVEYTANTDCLPWGIRHLDSTDCTAWMADIFSTDCLLLSSRHPVSTNCPAWLSGRQMLHLAQLLVWFYHLSMVPLPCDCWAGDCRSTILLRNIRTNPRAWVLFNQRAQSSSRANRLCRTKG